MDILFLSVSTGGGHIRAAQALKNYIETFYPSSRCRIVDTFKHISPLADKLIVKSYLNIINRLPFLYGSLYNLSERNKNIINATYTFSRLFSHKIIPLIREFKPSIIICTHTLPLQMVSYLKNKGIVNLPLVAIVTDYVNHPFWNLNNIDAIIVPHEVVLEDMVKSGIPKNIIYPFGIPLSTDFLKNHHSHKPNKKVLPNTQDIKGTLTGLIMGGSLGIRSVYSSFKMLINSERQMHINVVTGTNSRLRRKIDKQLSSYCTRDVKNNNSNRNNSIDIDNSSYRNSISFNGRDNGSNINSYIYKDKTIRVFGYTDKIPELMDMSDFIITKPGGMTIAEALVKKLPIFLMLPIPGQEERNLSFLIRNGAAVDLNPKNKKAAHRYEKSSLCDRVRGNFYNKISNLYKISNLNGKDNFDEILANILDNKEALENVKRAAEDLARPNACKDISILLKKLVALSHR